MHENDRHTALRPAIELWLVLLAIWAGLLVISAVPARAQLFGNELAKSELAQLWDMSGSVPAPEPRATPRVVESSRFLSAAATAERATPTPDETPQRILMLGDSMLDGLLPRLADYAVENGHSVNAVIWYGSRTIDWAHGTRLSDALRDYRPTFVIVVVGSSELTTRDIEKRKIAVDQILGQLGERKLVWIGPPNWRTDTGIGALLEREVGTPRYFRSLELSFERKRDGIHPTLASSRAWMDAAAKWIMTQSSVPIRLNPPTKTGAPRPNARVFPPPAP